MAANSKCAFAKENCCPVLAVFYYQRLRPHGKYLARSPWQAVFLRKHLGFAIIDEQDIHELQRLAQLLVSPLDPEVHGIAAGKFHVREFQPDRGLQRGMNVPKKQELRVFVLLGNSRLELFKNVQLSKICLRLIQVVQILAAPPKRFPVCMVDSTRVDTAFSQNVFMLGSEIFAHYRHHADVREVAGCQGKISRRAANNIFSSAGRSCDVVESDRTNGEYAHGEGYIYLALRLTGRHESRTPHGAKPDFPLMCGLSLFQILPQNQFQTLSCFLRNFVAIC